MPVTLNNYTYTAVDGDLTIATRIGKPRYQYPFEDDPSIYTVEEDFRIFIDYYEPLQPATRHTDINNIFYIKDSPIQDIGNGVGQYTRTWSVLPGYGNNNNLGYVRTQYESFAMTVPGITTDAQLFQQYTVTGYSTSNGVTSITTDGAHDIVTGKLVRLNYHVVDPINSYTYYRNAIRTALSAGGSSLSVAEVVDISPPIYDSLQRADVQQEPRTRTVTSKLEMSYFLPGVNIESVDAIPISKRLEIINNATGNITEYLKENSSPTLEEYSTWVGEGRWIQIEDSIIRRWQGEIYEKTDRFIRAIL